MRLQFIIDLRAVMQSEHDGKHTILHPDDIADMIQAAIWKTYAQPARQDAGIETIISISYTK